MKIGKYEFDLLHKGYIMGILNVTPDSFSDGGKYQSVDLALKQAERMIEEGAAILDIGGESTRPGHKKITDQEEIERVVPVIEAIKKNFDIAVSLDTYKYEVSKAGIAAGADMINDIWGLKWDERLAPLLAKEDVACCLMHNRDNQEYTNFIEDFCSDMEETLAIAKKAGIRDERIVLDPGVGFGKTFEQNLSIMKHMDVFSKWGLPVLLGTSRKSVIGLALNLPVDQREEGTAATTVLGRMKGASIFRVHDVKTNYRELKMIEAILDEIRVKNLEVFCHHGVYKEENVLGQKFLVNIVSKVDTRAAGKTDELELSVSYGDICRCVKKEMTKQNDKLLERVAERLAECILLQFPLIKEVEIEVKKPWAPVLMHVDYTSVKIKRSWHKVYIGVGSNLGEREEYMKLAKEKVSALPDTKNFKSASIIETEPYGYTEQGKFLNTVYSIETLDTPAEFLDKLHQIENEAERKREIHWGPRTLDLDILLYDDLVTEDEEITIPHPELTKRLFVLEPLCELAPRGIHPLERRRYSDILEDLKEKEK